MNASSKKREGCLAKLGRQVAVCPRCSELVRNRIAPVFGMGPVGAVALFVGEAPGRNEDEQGEPFVGAAGKMLDELLKEVGLSRERVYLTNIIKCRPPDNRTPHADEIANCRPYLEQQVNLIQPQAICALGRVVASALLDDPRPLAKLRGKVHRFQNIPLICTYHPAFVRRSPGMRPGFIRDMQHLLAHLPPR